MRGTHKYIECRAGLDGPAYRWKMAQDCDAGKLSPEIAKADAWVAAACDYLRLQAGDTAAKKRSAEEFPRIAMAHELVGNRHVSDQLASS